MWWERVGCVILNFSRIIQAHNSPHESISIIISLFGSDNALKSFECSSYILVMLSTSHRWLSMYNSMTYRWLSIWKHTKKLHISIKKYTERDNINTLTFVNLWVIISRVITNFNHYKSTVIVLTLANPLDIVTLISKPIEEVQCLLTFRW